MPYRVRPGLGQDMVYLMDIDNKCFDDPFTLDDWQVIDHASRIVVAADVVNKPAGFICYQSLEGHVFINRLAVHPSLQRRGIATSLVNECKQFCRSVRSLHVETRIPECWLGSVGPFLKANGFKAKLPMLTGYHYMGQPTSIVVFDQPM